MIFIKITAFFLLMYMANAIYAYNLNPGDPVDGGLFLYREDVEIFWNDWIAYPLTDRNSLPTPRQLKMTILGEGKTVGFIGNISINCENGRYFWRSAVNWDTYLTDRAEIAKVVPEEVIEQAVRLLCRS